MNSYVVTWVVDIDADDPREAAVVAREIMQDHDSIANVFIVTDYKGGVHQIDLNEEDPA